MRTVITRTVGLDSFVEKKKIDFFIQCLCASRCSMAFLVNDIEVILLAMHEVTFYFESALQSFPLE